MASLKLQHPFFSQSALVAAPALVGTIMVRNVAGTLRRARIIEVEAYLGPKDLASHASKGRTARTEVMFGPPGRAYVYFIYGMHWMFNVVVGEEGNAEALLIRAARPLDDWNVDLSGPAKLARAFAITHEVNGTDVTMNDVCFLAEPHYRPRINRTRRIGIDYARHWKNRLLRYLDVNLESVGKGSVRGKRDQRSTRNKLAGPARPT